MKKATKQGDGGGGLQWGASCSAKTVPGKGAFRPTYHWASYATNLYKIVTCLYSSTLDCSQSLSAHLKHTTRISNHIFNLKARHPTWRHKTELVLSFPQLYVYIVSKRLLVLETHHNFVEFFSEHNLSWQGCIVHQPLLPSLDIDWTYVATWSTSHEYCATFNTFR